MVPPALSRPRRTFSLLPLLTLLVGCGGGLLGNSAESEQRSISEYDLGRDAWLRRGDAREGLAHTLKALELDRHNADAQHLAALIYLDLCERSAGDCRLGQAEIHARAALNERADYREARNTLGVVLVNAGRPQEAIAVLLPLTQDILYTTPENAWANLGWAQLESGKVDEAIGSLERSVAAQPRFCVGFYRLGLAHERKSQPEAALDAFSQALEADSRCGALQAAYGARGRVALKLGRLEPARADLERCRELARETKAGKECDATLAKLK